MSRHLVEQPSVEVTCIKRGETDNAVKIFDPATEEECWIPLSQISEMHFNMKGEGTIVMTEWIAKKKGLA